MSKTKRLWRGLLACTLALIACTVLYTGLGAGHSTLNSPLAATAVPSYLFRFDPNTQVFYTYTLPVGSQPAGIVVTGTAPTHVWLALPERDVIGHLVYTDAEHVMYSEYPVTSTPHSQPFRLTLEGNAVWFTERGGNRIGRLDVTTGQIDEFYDNGLSLNAGLTDIRVAPNGWIWITGAESNEIIRLMVTSTHEYAFYGYTSLAIKQPFALAVETSQDPFSYYLWFTLPTRGTVGRLTPSTGNFLLPSGYPQGGTPSEIVLTPDRAWFSDPQNNLIEHVQLGTWSIVPTHGPISRPVGLAGDPSGSTRFWITQQTEQGGLARFVYTSTTEESFESFALPTYGLRPTGIAVARDNGVWFGAFAPFRAYLPVVVKI